MQTNLQELENIRTTILSLLLARKGGCTLRQLDNDYCEVEGTYIPWKDLGYTSLLCFLHSMSKNVQIEHKNNTIIIRGIATDKSKHVSKLVAGQKSQTNVVGRKLHKQSHYYPKTAPPKVCVPAEILLDIISLINNHPEGLSKDYVLQVIQAQMPFAHINMQEMEEQFRELSHKIFVRDSKVYPVSNKTKDFDHSVKTNDMYLPNPGSELYNKEGWESATVVAGGDEDSDDMKDYDDDFSFISTSDTCNKKPATNIKSTSNFIKESVSKCQEQAVEFKKLEQNNLHCLQGYEHNNDSQFCKESPNNVEKRKDHFKRKDSKHGEILINERVKFRLEKLIQNYPNGIWCAELPELYFEEYKIPLNYVELGFNSVREFASQLPDIFHCVQPCDTGDFKLHNAKGEIPSDLNTVKGNKKTPLAQLYQIYETDDEGALPLTVSLDVCKQLIPDDTMSIGESVGYISVETLTQNEKPYVEVIVVEVFTPSFFWIQLRKKQKIFKKFMDELHNFYIMKHDRYIVPPVVLEKGLNCACIYNDIWHRGIIKAVNPDLQVTVMFYDYGTLKTYPPESIHYLHKMFSYLPAQAIPCGLINTRPYKGSKWSRSATHHFAIRTQMPLVATIASINAEDNSMMITLTDTSEEEDVHINDWLVEQKLAEHGKMVCTKYRNFPFRYYLECQERFTQKFKVSKVLKKDQSTQYECIFSETHSQNDVIPSRNTNAEIKLARENNNNQADVNKVERHNKEMKKTLEFLKSCKSLQTSVSAKDTLSDGDQSPKKLNSLYLKLLNFKQTSYSNKVSTNNNIIDNSNNNIESDNSNTESDSSSISSKKSEQKLYKESSKLGNIKVKSNNVSNPSADSVLNNDNKITNISNNKYNILDKYSNIPVQYIHFCIQDPEDELDLYTVKRTDIYTEKHEIEHVDWFALCKNTRQEVENVSYQSMNKTTYKPILKRKDMPLPESCFLKVVQNSPYFAVNDKDIRWSPNGNIKKIDEDVPMAVLRNIKRWRTSESETVTVAIPEKIVESLTEKKSSVESLESKNTDDVQSTGSLKSDSKIISNEIPEHNAENPEENYYCFLKVVPSKYKLLEKLRTLSSVSTNTSELDSDDLSDSKSTPSLQNNSVENLKLDELKSNVNINESTLIDFSFEERRKEEPLLNAKDTEKSESGVPIFNDIDIESNEVSYECTESDVSDYVETGKPLLKDSLLNTNKKSEQTKRTVSVGFKSSNESVSSRINTDDTYEDKDSDDFNDFNKSKLPPEEPLLNITEAETSEGKRLKSPLMSPLYNAYTGSDKTSVDSDFGGVSLSRKLQSLSMAENTKEENKPISLKDVILYESKPLNEPISYKEKHNIPSMSPSSSNDIGSNETSSNSNLRESTSLLKKLESLSTVEMKGPMWNKEMGTVNESLFNRKNKMSGRSVSSSTDAGSSELSDEETGSDVSNSIERESILLSKKTEKFEKTTPVDESVSSEIATKISNIPVFNDIDVESDQEEWDVYIPHAKACDILRNFGFTDINDQLSYKSNSGLKITEINDANSIEYTNSIENSQNDNNKAINSNKLSDDEQYPNDKLDDLTSRPKKFEDVISVICSESNSDTSDKNTPSLTNTAFEFGKIQGKAKTLVEMLNKAKALHKDCVEK